MIYNTIIVGGGAAGLMCYHQLADANLQVLLIEKNASLGKKLLLTGNGRCNVTNNYSPKRFIEEIQGSQKKFFYKAIHACPTSQIVSFFEDQGLPLKLENSFQYFPVTNKAKDVLQVLTSKIDPRQVHYSEQVISLEQKQASYLVKTNKGSYETENLIFATGSKSFPKTGSSGDGVTFAKQLGIKTIPFYPAETKVYANQIKQLAIQGTQLSNVEITIKKTKHRKKGDLLFTHEGLSGPVIYVLSEFIHQKIMEDREAILSINLLNLSLEDYNKRLKENKQKTLETVVGKLTSKRFANELFKKYDLPKKQIQDLKKESLLYVYKLFSNFEVGIDRVEDVSLAYVNGGGVVTKELHPNTMESNTYKGLYFIGETIDLHGPIGGFNLTIAFSTAYMAANHIKEKISLVK